MGKQKEIIAHTVKDYPKDLEALFQSFVVVLENNEILVTDAYRVGKFAIVEVGPRENLSSNFSWGRAELRLGFQEMDNVLDIIYTGHPRMFKFLRPEIIKCFNKAVRQLEQPPLNVSIQTQTSTEDGKFCSNCGRKASLDANFCEGCGRAFNT